MSKWSVSRCAIQYLCVPGFAFACSIELSAQRHECSTPSPERLVHTSDAMMRTAQQSDGIMLSVFVTVFADDNGTNRAAEDSSILRQLNNMEEFYAPQGICFNLVGLRQINDSDLNFHDVSNEEGDLAQYLTPNTIDMFIHETLDDGGDPTNGNAYGIPNTYFSVWGGVIASAENRSTTAHEMGHCLGLYHTFETIGGEENVDRLGPCANCFTSGDLLCDTEADPHSDAYDTGGEIDTNCIYSGLITDDCDDLYVMDPHNIMAYGRRACRDVFTDGQGQRMVSFVLTNNGLVNCLTPATVSFSPDLAITHSSGTSIYDAINPITVQGDPLTVNGSATVNFSAPYIRVLPSVIFDPGATGSVHILPGTFLCD